MPIQPETLFSFPASVTMLPYSADGFYLEYPRGAAVLVFDHGAGQVTYRLLISLGGDEYQYDIETWQPDAPSAESPAQAAAEAVFKNAHPAFQDEDVPPYRLPRAD